MTTFAELQKEAQSSGEAFIDNATPAGHFGVTVKVNDITMVYLLKGKKGAGSATIKGRLELPQPFTKKAAIAYKGENLRGGEFQGPLTSFEDAFAKMV
jgi:hypothetical protein